MTYKLAEEDKLCGIKYPTYEGYKQIPKETYPPNGQNSKPEEVNIKFNCDCPEEETKPEVTPQPPETGGDDTSRGSTSELEHTGYPYEGVDNNGVKLWFSKPYDPNNPSSDITFMVANKQDIGKAIVLNYNRDNWDYIVTKVDDYHYTASGYPTL